MPSATLTRLMARRVTTVSLWRSPATSGGKVGAMTQQTTGIALKLWPAAATTAAPQILVSVPANTRIDFYGFVLPSVDVRRGDELRDASSRRYKVEGVGVWSAVQALALSLVAPAAAGV